MHVCEVMLQLQLHAKKAGGGVLVAFILFH